MSFPPPTNVIPAQAGIQGLRDNMRFIQKPKPPHIGTGNLPGGIYPILLLARMQT